MPICGDMRRVVAHAVVKHEITLDKLVQCGRCTIDRMLCIVDPDLALWDVARIHRLVTAIDKIHINFIAKVLSIDEIDRNLGNTPQEAQTWESALHFLCDTGQCRGTIAKHDGTLDQL